MFFTKRYHKPLGLATCSEFVLPVSSEKEVISVFGAFLTIFDFYHGFETSKEGAFSPLATAVLFFLFNLLALLPYTY